MAKGYRPVARDQAFLLPPDMREWLPAGHPVWLVIEVIDHHLDTSAVHRTRRAGRAGASGYDPDMLTGLLVWAYANRVTSSRRIEALCRTDIAFKIICGAGRVPDHVTIARFRAGLGSAAGALFTQVLMLCARLGMGQLGLVALDGMKIAASASKSANRTEEGLRKLAGQIAAEHAATDAAEDALFGPGVRGDEVPAELADPRTRDERIAAALAGIQAEQHAAQRARDDQASRYLAAEASGQRQRGPLPAAAAVEAAQIRLDQAIAAQQAKIDDWQARNAASLAAGGKGLRGGAARPREPASQCKQARNAAAVVDRAKARAAAAAKDTTTTAAAAAKDTTAAAAGPDAGPVRNITDPQSRLMPARGGFLQGYNTQNVTTADGLIIATALTHDTTDTRWFEPMLTAAGQAAAVIAASQPPGTSPGRIGLILADAGYLSEHNLTCPGPDRLSATGKTRGLQHTARHPRRSGGPARGPAVQAMAARLATSDGITAYRQRGHIAETPHGHIKHNLGFRQLSMRGTTKATAEWTLAATVHNLFKAITTGHLTQHTLAALTS